MQVELVVPPPTAKAKRKALPMVVFLLLACYGVMALVVVEQGSVIQSQRRLIQTLSEDSQQLASLKNQEAAQHAIEKKQAKARGKASHSVAPPKEQAQKQLSRKSKVEKQPLQADDKIDRRRFPAQI